jgi:hypothetical protein
MLPSIGLTICTSGELSARLKVASDTSLPRLKPSLASTFTRQLVQPPQLVVMVGGQARLFSHFSENVVYSPRSWKGAILPRWGQHSHHGRKT